MLCIEELKLQLLAKSSICPGIITIIWSLITSDTGGSDENGNDIEPDDTVTELLNNKITLEACIAVINEKNDVQKKQSSKSSAKIEALDKKLAKDIFASSSSNQNLLKRQE